MPSPWAAEEHGMPAETTTRPPAKRGHSLRGRPLVLVHGAQGPRFDPATFTVAELFAVYTAEHLPSKAQTTIYQYRRLLDWIAESLGPLRLVDLTPAVLRQWRDAVLAMGYQPQTVHRYCGWPWGGCWLGEGTSGRGRADARGSRCQIPNSARPACTPNLASL